MYKQLIVDSAKCTGCGLCLMVCSAVKHRQFTPNLARIKIWREEVKGVLAPLVCQQCMDPPCAEACLMNVISKDPDTGLTIRNSEGCIGCRACQIACPFEACSYDYLNDIVVNCDHCGGKPECVHICPTGALQYLPPVEALICSRDAAARRRTLSAGL